MTPTGVFTLSPAQERALEAEGRNVHVVMHQLALLSGPVPHTRLVRAARVGDGLVQIAPVAYTELEHLWAQARAAGRLSSFIPASGAATRLCAALLRVWQGGGDAQPADREEAARVLGRITEFAFWPALQALGVDPRQGASVFEGLLGAHGLGLSGLPKALIAFHRYADGARTALEEQLSEAWQLTRHDTAEATNVVRVALSVQAEHQGLVQAHLGQFAQRQPRGAWQVQMIPQDPRTDTPTWDDEAGAPRLRPDGTLAFFPGGHGSLLASLERSGGEFVFVRNIDNAVREEDRSRVVAWRARLAGLLLRTQAEAWRLLAQLEEGQGVDEAICFVQQTLGRTVEPDPAALIAQIHRPWRVAGMVKNLGQPGGGPFWVQDAGGVSLQIVESAQIDCADPVQAAILASSTHFNPVEMVLGLRDRLGRPWALSAFTDPQAVLVTRKYTEGRHIRLLEHPGLWNGQMSGWNSIFVEIPHEVFQPVKVLSDLLSPAHAGPMSTR